MFPRLLIIFITIPMIELILFLTVGDWIGLPATVGVVILTGLLGAWLSKREGLRTLHRFRSAMAEGRLPHQEVMEGLIILLAGAVLLTPGFLTDAVGFLLLIPPVRAVVVRWLKESLKNRLRLVVPGAGTMGTPDKPAPARQTPPGKVIDVEVVND